MNLLVAVYFVNANVMKLMSKGLENVTTLFIKVSATSKITSFG